MEIQKTLRQQKALNKGEIEGIGPKLIRPPHLIFNYLEIHHLVCHTEVGRGFAESLLQANRLNLPRSMYS